MFVLNHQLFIYLFYETEIFTQMNKSTQKRPRYNVTAVKKIAEKYGYTERYVRMCVRGDVDGVMPDKVVKDYKALAHKLESVTKNFINQ